MKKNNKKKLLQLISSFIQHFLIVVLADLTMEIFKRLI